MSRLTSDWVVKSLIFGRSPVASFPIQDNSNRISSRDLAKESVSAIANLRPNFETRSRMIRRLVIACSCLCWLPQICLPQISCGDIIHMEDFEDAIGYQTTPSEFTNNSTRYFVRSNFSNINNAVNYNVVQGSFFFGAQEVDLASTFPVQLNITNIDISGETTLFFSGLFAEDDVLFEEDWDAEDYLHVSYQIDGGGFQNLFWIESAGALNSAAMVDTDFDGEGDGAIITDTFTEFTAAIFGTGSSLDLRIEISLNDRQEDIAFDNLSIRSGLSTSIPEPGVLGLLGLMSLPADYAGDAIDG